MKAKVARSRCLGQALVVVLILLVGLWGHPTQAAETTTYMLTDAQGTVLAREDAHGTTIATYDYRPYGKQQTGPTTPGPGYTGHVNDPDTGFVYMQARYYDADTGRFISADPEPFAPGSTLLFNRFAYANNNPIINTDPNGRMAQVAVNGNRITIRFPVVYGKGASPIEQLAYNASIERNWSGNFGRYVVEMHVVPTSPFLLPRNTYNIIDVGRMNPSVVGGQPYTDRVGGNYIKLATLPFPDNGSFDYLAWTAGHEAGHAMWLTDKYAGDNMVLPPYDKNIMGASMQGPSEGDVSTIINQNYAPELNGDDHSESIPSAMSGGRSRLDPPMNGNCTLKECYGN